MFTQWITEQFLIEQRQHAFGVCTFWWSILRNCQSLPTAL